MVINKKKAKFTSGLFIMLSTIFYLFWPLSSEKFKIETDASAVEYKTAFLTKNGNTPEHELPNILLIMADDLGMSDLTLYGDGYPETPNIDRLGKQGVVFTNAYVTSPVCSPSRAAILTGRYPQRFGFQYQLHERYPRNRFEILGFNYIIRSRHWVPKWLEEVPDRRAIANQGMPTSEILLPELLKTRGYETAIIGKWHLGADAQRTPCQFGFDYQYGFYASHSLYAYENSPGIHDQKVDKDFTDEHIWNGQRDGPHAIYKNCEEIVVTDYLTDRFANEAISYLQAQRTRPFFLYLSFNAPHTPLQAPIEYMEKFNHLQDPVKRTYCAMISNLDDNIGRVISALEASGLAENTILFFISDNGGAEYTLTTDNGKYKGGKITDLEGGIKVPFFIYWKNQFHAGVYHKMVSSMDIFQTIIDVSGAELPTDRVYDGVTLIPFISGEKKSNPHDYLYWQRGFSKTIRDNEWKLSINEEARDTVLFNLKNDPYETTDIYKNNPIIATQLAIAHKEWSHQLPAPLWPSMIYYYFKDGDKQYYFDQ
jgi:arylsulfatase A-like enzyme